MRYLTLIVLAFFTTLGVAQKEDYTWVIGHDYNFDDDEYGRVEISFKTNPPTINHFIGEENMNMYITNVSMSDSSGGLIFYSNGCNIANEYGQVIPNGDGLNPGAFHDQLCNVIGRGYGGGFPNAVILPLPENDSIFYVFHGSVKYIPPPQSDAYIDRILKSIVKVNGNKKSVIEKNIPVMIDSLSTGELNAVRHANGQDWWIVLPRRNSNQIYIFLFTKEGIVDTLVQTIGGIPPSAMEGYGQTVFSSDGTRMIRYFPYTDIMNYTFDRSLGRFTSYYTFSVDYGSDFADQGGCAISPSGRYLYISALLQVYQFDLWASDISTSQIKVATWDGFVDPIAISFWFCQLGPDCKIYINGGGDTRYYHIIHNPDEPGLACNVEQRGLVFPIPSGASIPYFPNYRLGPIDNPGLPCSPVVATQQPGLPLPEGRAWPNPAREQLNFSMTNDRIKNISLNDALGRELKTITLSSEGEAYTMSVGDMASGVYFWRMEGVGGTVVVGKVLIGY